MLDGEDDLNFAGGRGYGHPLKTASHRPNRRYDIAARGALAPEKSGTSARATLDDRQSAAPLGTPGAPRSLYRPSGDTDRTAGQSGDDYAPGVGTLSRDA